jgi:diaminohydroxyphosphoribosylaminopyrimidine deaminase / 5-amino-6-(5-phosphoribosylamino)uracil reductase
MNDAGLMNHAGLLNDANLMQRAIANAAAVRASTSPNPWVGAVVVADDGTCFDGATQPPGGAHAEVMAFHAAGEAARGATIFTTLEPCSHHGRTPPCVDAIIAAGVNRVVVGIEDPDPKVAGRGLDALRAAGIEVAVGIEADAVRGQLAPYLHHRITGRPFVVLKLASTLDGRIAAADGTSQWITGAEARTDAHRLRAESDAILVGAGTVRDDDPSLTVRHVDGRDPLRVVLGRAAPGAKVHPCLERTGELTPILDELGGRDVVQLLVEGGATVAHRFHAEGLVNQYVIYLAPALAGGDDCAPLFRGPGAASIGDMWRGAIVSVKPLGPDVRIVLDATKSPIDR